MTSLLKIFEGAIVLSLLLSCSDKTGKSTFTGTDRKLKIKESPKNPVGEGLPSELDPTQTGFALTSPTRTALNAKEVWAVTSTEVYRIEIDDDAAVPSFPTTKWSTPPNTGARTFVSEVGLFFGRSKLAETSEAIGLNWASDQNPGKTVHVHKPAVMAVGSRFCVTSWKHENQVYVGGGYFALENGVNRRKFVRLAVKRDAAGKVSFGSPEVHDFGEGAWGYTCYTDQARKWYWANHWGIVHGVDLATMTAIPADKAPNANHKNDISDYEFTPTRQGSYSMNGDDKGNLLSAKAPAGSGLQDYEASYAWGFDPVSKFLFGSTWNKDKFYVSDPACFSTVSSCPVGQKHFVFNGMLQLGSLGPMSSLNDGRVAAWSRAGHHQPPDNLSYLYLVSLKDPAKPASGLKIKKIKDVPGETYMYTDFTGATLYPADVRKTIDLTQASSFRPGIAVSKLALKWSAESGAAEAWRGLAFELRCYSKGAATIPAFQKVSLPEAGTLVDLPNCQGNVDTVDIRISGSGESAGFSRTKTVEFTGSQKADAAAAPGTQAPSTDPTATPTATPTAVL